MLAFINRPNGDFTFNGQYTGNAAADFLLGLPAAVPAGDAATRRMDGTSWLYAAYVQDEFRLVAAPHAERRPALRAGAAVRREGRQAEHVPSRPAVDALPGRRPPGLVYPGDPGVPRGTYDDRQEQRRAAAGRRLGLRRATAATSVRAAWGIFYDALAGQGDFFQNGMLAPPFQPLTEVNYAAGATLAASRTRSPASAGGAAGFPPGLIFIGWGERLPARRTRSTTT